MNNISDRLKSESRVEDLNRTCNKKYIQVLVMYNVDSDEELWSKKLIFVSFPMWKATKGEVELLRTFDKKRKLSSTKSKNF